MNIEDLPDPAPLRDQLIYLYSCAQAVNGNEKEDEFIDTLKQYASALMLASTASILSLLDIDIADMQIVQLTEEQRDALVVSGTLDAYLDGKDRTDD